MIRHPNDWRINFEVMYIPSLATLLVFYILYKAFMFYYQHWVYKKDYTPYKGEWAAITGASYGIGKYLAIGLAKRGINVALIARSKDKLEEVSKECLKYNVQTKVFALDLTKKESFEILKNAISDVTILFNNAGGLPFEQSFYEFTHYTPEDFHYQFDLNFFAAVETCKIALPNMVKKNRGIILNISSVASKTPYWLSPYSSAKNAVNGFSHALFREYGSQGVNVQTVIVGMVDTPLTTQFDKSIDCILPEQLAEETIDGAGFGDHEIIPAKKHHFFTSILLTIPDFIRYRIIKHVYNQLKKDK